jgi:integrase
MVKVRQYRRRGKPSGFWEVDVRLTLPSGVAYRERVRVPVTGRTNARRWAEAREAEVLALARQGLDVEAIRARLQGKEVEEEQKTIPTLAEFKSRFFEGHVKANRLKPSSAETYEILFKTHLEPVLGSLRLDTIGDELVQRFKGELVEDELANKSINNILTALSVMLKHAVEWKVIEAMPCRIRLLKVDRPELAFYDFGEYRRLVDAAVAIDPRIELLALLGGDAGLRRGEAMALEWTDLDLKRGSVHVQRSEWDGNVTTPKGGRSRRLPLTARLAEALRAHRHLKGPRVLCHEDGTGIGRKAVHEWMEKAQCRAGLPSTGTFHILRHTFCSHLAMQGATAKAIQELAGHQDLSTTQRYMHLSPAHKDAAIRLLDHRPKAEGVEAGVEAVPTAAEKGRGDS